VDNQNKKSHKGEEQIHKERRIKLEQ
jgi:hypothetical protein